MLGQVLGDRYKVIDELGHSENRLTLMARDIETQAPVVIKVLQFGKQLDWDQFKLFKREAETLAALNHESIPRYIDYFEIDAKFGSKGFALVQSYIEGRSLEQYLRSGRKFSEAEVKQIAQAMLGILSYLHELEPPVIHRDIKPSNILLSDRAAGQVDQVYLVDFGAVQNFGPRESSTFTMVGTQGYMPPEQFSGRVTAASDLYSLGMTLITLATGVPATRLPRRNLRVQFEQLVDLDPDFAAWLKWLTQPGVTDRPAAADEALQVLTAKKRKGTNASATDQEVVRKPPESPVKLLKTASTLEVRVPIVGVTLSTALLGLLAIGLWGAAAWKFVQFIKALPSLALLKAALGLLLGLGAVGLTLLTLFLMFGQIRLRLDQYQIARSYGLFSRHIESPKPEAVRKVIRLDYTSSASRNPAKAKPQSRKKAVPGISMQAGAKRFELCNNFWFALASRLRGSLPEADAATNREYRSQLLTGVEMEWLAHEISTWLKVPVNRR